MVFAAIDIGSNAVRLLFTNVLEEDGIVLFRKQSFIRVPLRLGEDSFVKGRIGSEKQHNLLKTMHAFRHLIDVQKPIGFLACATSAMRNADNADELLKRIKKETGIHIEMIDGQREAEIIYSNHVAEYLDPDIAYLYVEVGGGSTELTLFHNYERIFSRSFKIGTVRLLHGLQDEKLWNEMKDFIKDNAKGYTGIQAIGTGGNINSMAKMIGKKESQPITLREIRRKYRQLSAMTIDERVRDLGLRPDRADVIIPAGNIYMSVMKWARIKKMFVPKIGLADGLIHVLYENHINNNTSNLDLKLS